MKSKRIRSQENGEDRNMTSERALRTIDLRTPAKFVIRGINGSLVKIKVKHPTEAQKKALFETFDFIRNALTIEEYREEIELGMQTAGFLITDSRAVGAYTAPVTENDTAVI